MLQVHENEISLHKWSGGTAQLRTLKTTLVIVCLILGLGRQLTPTETRMKV